MMISFTADILLRIWHLLEWAYNNPTLIIISLCVISIIYSLFKESLSVIPFIIIGEQLASNPLTDYIISLSSEVNELIVETIFVSLVYFATILLLVLSKKSNFLVSIYCIWVFYSASFELDYYIQSGAWLYHSYDYAIGLVNILIIAGLFEEAAKGGGKRALLDRNSNLPAYGFSSMADSSLHYPVGMGRYKRTV